MSAFVRSLAPRTLSWLVPLVFTIACSDSDEIDFFEPGDDTMQTGGSTATSGGTDAGGSSNGGTVSAGGAEPSGGTGATTGGSAGDSGGSQNQGGSDTGGMGGTGAEGGSDVQGGSSGTAGDGMTTGGMGGGAGDAMGGAGAGGAGMAGAGMAGAGMAGAGLAGAGMGGGAAGAGGCVPTTPTTERCDGVDNNCMGGVDEGMACPANCTGATRAGHSYMFCSFENVSGGSIGRERTWLQAMDFCQMRDLNLVFIESAEENAFILEWITRTELEDQVWIGATDRDLTLQNNEGEWVWGASSNAVQFWDGNENGEAVMDRYEDWASGEPNNDGNEDCGVMASNHEYRWDDRDCSDAYMNFVCESGAATTQN